MQVGAIALREYLRRLRRSPLLLVALFATAVVAAGTYADFLQSLAQRESGNRPGVVNRHGYAGLFQMGGAALHDAGYYTGTNNRWQAAWTGRDGINSLQDFLASPQAQVNAITAYHQVIQRYIRSNGLDAYIGRTVNGVTVTQSGLIAGAHLVGMGNLRTWLQSNGRAVPRDGNQVPITAYVQQFAGYGVSAAPPNYWGAAAPPPPAPQPGGGGAAPPPAGRPVMPGNVAPAFGSADQAFAATTGQSMGAVRTVVATILVTLFFLWMSWSLIAHYRGWMQRGIGSFATFQRSLFGGLVLTLVLMAIMR